jgi:hypothetical protein
VLLITERLTLHIVLIGRADNAKGVVAPLLRFYVRRPRSPSREHGTNRLVRHVSQEIKTWYSRRTFFVVLGILNRDPAAIDQMLVKKGNLGEEPLSPSPWLRTCNERLQEPRLTSTFDNSPEDESANYEEYHSA